MLFRSATVPDPAQREALTKAETEIARLKIQVERQNSNAVVEAKKNQEALAAAQAEVQRLTEEVGALRTAAPIGGADPKVLAEALDEIARLEAQVERQGASAVAREKRHQDIMDAGRAEAQRLASELHALKNAPRPPATDGRSQALPSRIASIWRPTSAMSAMPSTFFTRPLA